MKKFLSYLLLFVMLTLCLTCGFYLHYIAKIEAMISRQIEPEYLLKKYEWFKDASASLDKKIADIKVYEKRIKSIEDGYAGKSRGEWLKDDREAHRQAESELVGKHPTTFLLKSTIVKCLKKIGVFAILENYQKEQRRHYQENINNI